MKSGNIPLRKKNTQKLIESPHRTHATALDLISRLVQFRFSFSFDFTSSSTCCVRASPPPLQSDTFSQSNANFCLPEANTRWQAGKYFYFISTAIGVVLVKWTHRETEKMCEFGSRIICNCKSERETQIEAWNPLVSIVRWQLKN